MSDANTAVSDDHLGPLLAATPQGDHWKRDGRIVRNLIVESGFFRGFAGIGALEVLDPHVTWERTAGTSIGALAAALVAAGCSTAEILAIYDDLDPRLLRHVGSARNLDDIGKIARRIGRGHLFDGRRVHAWMRDMFAAIGINTFADIALPHRTDLPPHQRFALMVVVGDLNTRSLLRLPWDARRLGIDPAALSVPDAVYASCAIPYVFTPLEVDVNGQTHHLVDGGVVRNIPITAFSAEDTYATPIGSIALRWSTEAQRHDYQSIRNVLEFRRALDEIRAVARESHYRMLPGVTNPDVIEIDTSVLTSSSSAPAPDVIDALIENGRVAARRYLATRGMT